MNLESPVGLRCVLRLSGEQDFAVKLFLLCACSLFLNHRNYLHEPAGHGRQTCPPNVMRHQNAKELERRGKGGGGGDGT